MLAPVSLRLLLMAKDTLNLFSLHFEKGLSHVEIARQTKLPIGTVKTKLRRGLIDARKLLKDFDHVKGVAS